ncbi:MAG: hypothetical protein BWX69_03151 [Planctomycetes bacterium ADurb.Bin069]|nr:MAG: hypothetical protein BWX69_03151 [Planctomycetes bacterium ADurb.Bin069]
MSYADTLSARDLRRLARQGHAMEAAFRFFARQTLPGAGNDQLLTARRAFFAGAAEFWAMNDALDDSTAEPTAEDMAFIHALVAEVYAHHERTLAAARRVS